MTQIDLGSSLSTFYGYWGYSGTYDNNSTQNYTGYGRLWKIKTGTIQETNYTWDPGGNLTQRDMVSGQTDNFTYDFLDRLSTDGGMVTTYSPGDANGDGLITTADVTYVEGVILGLSPSTAGCDSNQDGQINVADVTAIENMLTAYYITYDSLGNITSMRGNTYSYGAKPHAVTSVGSTNYTYDNNGNMTWEPPGHGM